MERYIFSILLFFSFNEEEGHALFKIHFLSGA